MTRQALLVISCVLLFSPVALAKGKVETELVSLPLEDNRIMIYTDLGVYAGQRLGTPCDDLL